jgi:hypothetical protein
LKGSEGFGTVIFDPSDQFVLDYPSSNSEAKAKPSAWRAADGTRASLEDLPQGYAETWGRWKFLPQTQFVARIRRLPKRDGRLQEKQTRSTITTFIKSLETIGPGPLSEEELKRLDEQIQGLPARSELAGRFDVIYLDHRRMVTQFRKSPQQWALDSYNEIRVWEMTTGQPITRPLIHSGEMLTVIFSEGGFMATGFRDGDVRVWSDETFEPITPRLRSGQAMVPRALSSDGRRLVTSAPLPGEELYQPGQEQGLRVWDFGTNEGRSLKEWKLLAQAIAGRRTPSTRR